MVRRGHGAMLACLTVPFGLAFLAAAVGRYPYGTEARLMQFAAPSICLLSGLGAAVAIDGPFHGERVASPLTPPEYQSRMAAEGIGRVLDRMADDWVAARDLLVDVGTADPTRQAYFGLSMGTRFGLEQLVMQQARAPVLGEIRRPPLPHELVEVVFAVVMDVGQYPTVIVEVFDEANV